MDQDTLRDLLSSVRDGQVSPDEALERLRHLPYEDLTFAKLDHHRTLRRGFPEAVYGEGKTPEQILAIVDRMVLAGQNVLVTRTSRGIHELLTPRHPEALFHEAARALTLHVRKAPALPGSIAVVCAGTSDLPVAEEAAVTAAFLGAEVERVYDVGVAGLHRLIDQLPRLRACRAIVVAAGMEGALPSVVGGLVAVPVIAVPTSVGYGASFGGLSALLSMLNACAPGISVVNIDNGFGAGYVASLILRGVAVA